MQVNVTPAPSLLQRGMNIQLRSRNVLQPGRWVNKYNIYAREFGTFFVIFGFFGGFREFFWDFGILFRHLFRH